MKLRTSIAMTETFRYARQFLFDGRFKNLRNLFSRIEYFGHTDEAE